MKESKAYKTYYDFATGKVIPKPKKKLHAQGLETLSEIALSEADQMKLITKRSKTQFHSSHASYVAQGQLCFQNPFYLKQAQQLEPKLYDGNVIKNTHAIVITDSEETLMLAEESRSKMLLKQQDPMVLEKKVNTTSVDYAGKDLVITARNDELRKLKGKDLVDNVVTKHTIAPEMLKIDVEPIALDF
ncbi:hypothetical protein Tco_0006488 [Tanacetum coccineum]